MIDQARRHLSSIFDAFIFLFSPQKITLSLFFQVGDVLVERTVGEVLPAVEQNLAQIEEVRG